MTDQLIRYVDLLFAGAPNAADIQQEILQNTLDRYDDLVAQGKTPQAAYSLAIAGIGDVSELLSAPVDEPQATAADTSRRFKPEYRNTPLWKKLFRVSAIFLYIISIIPLIVLSEFGMEVIGFCGTIGIVGVATVLIIIASGGSKPEPKEEKIENLTPNQEMRKAVKNAISTVGLVLYFVISFATGAWYITWVIFLIIPAVEGIVTACMDLKEAGNHEN